MARKSQNMRLPMESFEHIELIQDWLNAQPGGPPKRFGPKGKHGGGASLSDAVAHALAWFVREHNLSSDSPTA